MLIEKRGGTKITLRYLLPCPSLEHASIPHRAFCYMTDNADESFPIPTKCHDTPLSSGLMGGGVIQVSTTARVTEDAIGSNEPDATNTIAEMERKGLFRCSVDGRFHPRHEFAPDKRKRNGIDSICKEHRAAQQRGRTVTRMTQAVHRTRFRMRKTKNNVNI